MESGISSIVGGLHARIASSRDLISHTEDTENHDLFIYHNACRQDHMVSEEMIQALKHSSLDTPSISSYDTAPTVIDYIEETDTIQANNVEM